MSAAAAYLVGRSRVSLASAQGAADKLFAGDRIDGSELQNLKFAHCTFANVSFKNCTLNNIEFANCVFIGCYFRGTRIERCRFIGAKFVECDLSKVDIRATDFKFYNSFSGCYLPFREIEQSLPTEGNLRAHLCLNLASEARKSGALKDEGLYRQAGAAGMEQHLLAAARHSTQYFREKYAGSTRWKALLEYIASRTRGFLWGYKSSSFVVLRNWSITTLVLFPLLFLIFRDGIYRADRPVTTPEIWLASIGNILPGSGISDIRFVSTTCLVLAFVEVLIGLLFTGIVAALIFRAVFDRWR